MKSVISTVKCRDDDELFKTLSEELPVGVCIMQDGKFCYVNSTFPIAIGYTVDELVGKDSLEIVVPEDREMVKEDTMKMLKGELRSPYQFRVTCKDGSIVWVMATAKSIQYHGKRATLGNYMEITERKLMEEAAKESEERYKELANSITDVFFAMDENLRYTYWNKASEILTGVRMEDAIGKSIQEVFSDRPWRRKAEKMYRKVLKTLQLQTFVNDYDIDGKHYILEINAYPSRGGVSVFVKDISERKRAEEARREAEEETRALLEEAPVTIVHTDLKGKIIYVNERFESESGYSRGEVIGKSGFQVDWFPASTLTFLAERMVARLGGSPAKHWETQFKCKDGRRIWIELEGKILSRSEVPVGFEIIATNITERKQAEEKLKESEQKYRLLFETSPDCIAQLDREGRHLAANPAVVKSLGVPLGKLIGKTVLEVAPQEVGQRRLEMVKKALDEWQPQILEDERAGRYFHHMIIPTKTSEQKEVVQVITRDITERKQAEKALQKSEERYRVLAENAGEAIFVVQDDVVKFINPKGVELSGYSGKELASRPFTKFIYPDDIHMVADRYLKRLRGELVPQTYDLRIIRKDGDIRWGELNAVPISWEDRPAVLCFMSDITERKQAVEGLRQSEERYRTILEEMEDAYFEVDLGGHLTFVNNSVCRDLGYSREELMGKSYKAFVVEEDIEPVFQVFHEVYRTDVPNKGFPWKTIRKDGTHGFAETSISLLRNDKGEAIGFRGVGRDITERKQAEQRLRQSEENYRALFDSSVIGTIVLDAETRKTVMANQAAAKIFGFSSPQEGVGRNPLNFVPPEDKEMVLEVIGQDLFEQDVRRTAEFRAVTKSGREIWLSVTAARIMHEGKLAGLISFADITEQKRQSERLMMTDRLASIGELAAGAAHELNNPLTSIIGFCELLMEKDAPDYIRKDLAMIRSEAQRAANVTSNLLTFARKHRPVKQLTRINDVIEEVLKLRAYAHKSNCIEVERDLASDLPEIPLDHFQMQQVIINIVINAEYFMTQAHKKGTLTVSTKRQNSSILVSFSDDGPGIAAENLGRIFDPFFTTKEAGKGTGLGLSICHGTVAEHGGQIYATSQPGKGATIFIELPINGNNRVGVAL